MYSWFCKLGALEREIDFLLQRLVLVQGRLSVDPHYKHYINSCFYKLGVLSVSVLVISASTVLGLSKGR